MKFTIFVALISSKALNAFVPQSPSSFLSRELQLSARKPGRKKRAQQQSGGDNSKSSNNKGFSISKEKTYGQTATSPSNDLIDVESAMNAFFSDKEDWAPLFRSLATRADAPAMAYLGGGESSSIDFNEATHPWRRLPSMPNSDEDKMVISNFLDAWQVSLVNIPLDEATKEDAMDMHFLEEGRRVVCISRFQVIRDNKGGTVENNDSLFWTCWNELAELARNDEPDTGSLILVPDYDLNDLRRFTDINLQRPMEWLGMEQSFEVTAMQRGSPAIRLIHKLSAMPTEPYRPEEGQS